MEKEENNISDINLEKIRLFKDINSPKYNDMNLREEIIVDNIKLVKYVANEYVYLIKVYKDELESYGYEGLIYALDNYDINSGNKFSTYAFSCIKGYILGGIQQLLLNKKINLYYQCIKTKKILEKDNSIKLSNNPELVEEAIIDVLKSSTLLINNENISYVRRLYNCILYNNVSLNSIEDIENLNKYNELIDDTNYEDIAIKNTLKDEIKRLLVPLTKREKEVIKILYGLDDGIFKSKEEVGTILNITSSRVSQLEKNAISKIRNIKNCSSLILYLR